MTDQLLKTYLYRGYDHHMNNQRTAFIIDAPDAETANDIGKLLFEQQFGFIPYTSGSMQLIQRRYVRSSVDDSNIPVSVEVFNPTRVAFAYDHWFYFNPETNQLEAVDPPAPLGEVVPSPFAEDSTL